MKYLPFSILLFSFTQTLNAQQKIEDWEYYSLVSNTILKGDTLDLALLRKPFNNYEGCCPDSFIVAKDNSFRWNEMLLRPQVRLVRTGRFFKKGTLVNAKQWAQIKKHYKTECVLELSLPSFSPSREYAILYIGYYCGPNNGTSKVVQYKKTDGKWALDKVLVTRTNDRLHRTFVD